MIVRAVLANPELLDKFDWFNDGQNTINWLRGLNTPVANGLAEKMYLQLYPNWQEEQTCCRKP